MNLYKKYKTDEAMEKNGIRVNYGKNSKNEDIIFILARAGGENEVYHKVVTSVITPVRRQLKTLDAKTANKLLAEVYAKSVVIGWEGVEDENDNPIVYSVDNVIKVLTDLPELFADIQEVAGEAQAFQKISVEDDAKN